MTDRPVVAHASHNDCWNGIGVRGDQSCRELKQYVHCRNCPVYAEAALALLDKELPTDHTDWTSHVAMLKPIGDSDRQSVVIFRIAVEWLGLPILVVKEVAATRPIHSVPHRGRGVVLGVANIRGELLVCVSLDRVLGLEPPLAAHLRTGPADRRRLLVMRREHVSVVCPVDEVLGVCSFARAELKEVPSTVGKAAIRHSSAVVAWRGHSVGVLDDHLLFEVLHRSLA
jgi:chemotaxis-related protein WspD